MMNALFVIAGESLNQYGIEEEKRREMDKVGLMEWYLHDQRSFSHSEYAI